MKKINFYLRSLFLMGLSVILLQNAELRAQTVTPSKLDILKYWAPQVFQDTRCDYTLFHQFYQAQDYIIKVNFDNNWYAGDQHENSNLNSGSFPGMEGHCYGWFVETETHYFLKYGYYHSMDDAVIAADRHENDFESVEMCIRKANNSYGLFRCMKTTYHSSDKTYTYDSNLTFNDSHPRIYISSNGDVTGACGIYAHGHGIEAYIPGTHCTGSDAIIYNIADIGTIPTETGDGAFTHSYDYSIIDVDEFWNRRSNYDNYPFQSYGNFGGDGNESNGGNVGLDQNCATDFVSTFSWLTTEAPYSYVYLHNPYSPGSGAVASLQGNWTGVDIGNPAKTGYSWSYRDVYTIDGGGSDIWETSDQFHYTYQQLSGNGQIVARLYTMQEDLNGWSKAGVMIRETLNDNSKFAMMVGTPDNGVAFQTRSTTGGSCTNSSINGIIAPVWLKIVRTGNVFTAYYSTNGTTWIQNGTSTISMDSSVFIGMAVTSRNTGYLCSATFDNVSLTGTTFKSANDITNLLGTISSQYNDSPSGENNTNLIDNNLNTKFLTFNASSWVQYKSTDKYIVNRYTITSANDAPERDPLSWTFQGSNNGNDWTTLDSRSGEDFPNRLQTRSFSFNNSMSYSYYRINMNNNSGNILQLAEIEIFGVASNDITNLGGTATAQYNDSPSGEDYSKLIDNNVNTKYLTFHSSGWINYQAQSPNAVSGYTITSANDAPERDPLSWTFQGSNNGVDWTTIDTRSGEDFPNRLQTRLFSFNNTSPYSYFRFNLNNNSGSILQLAEIEIFGIADSTSGLLKSASCPLSINAVNPIQSGKAEVVHKSEITDNIAVYPNPAQEFVTLTNVPAYTSIIILNIYGQVLLQTKSFVEQRDFKVDIHDLKVGMYIVKIGNKEGKTLEFLKK